jgi:hypothetical protein
LKQQQKATEEKIAVVDSQTERTADSEYARDQLLVSLECNDLGWIDILSLGKERGRKDEAVIRNLQVWTERLDEQSRSEDYPDQDRQPSVSPAAFILTDAHH